MTKMTAYRYPEGTAPFGRMDIIVPNARRGDDPLSILYIEPGAITREAWLGSEWFAEDVGFENLERYRCGVATFADAANSSVGDAYVTRGGTAALAIAPAGDEMPQEVEATGGLLTGPVVGYASGRTEISGNVLFRAGKRLFSPGRVYRCINNVNVLPENQGSHIGAALLHAALDQLPDLDRYPTTTYASATNTSLIRKLGELGYEKTGSRPRTDLVAGVTIEEVRLQAESVAAVLLELEVRYPWLHNMRAVAVSA